jgi:hypothetical protein
MYVTKDKRILISEILKLGMSKPFYDVDVRIVVGREFVDSVSMSIRDRGVPVHSKGLYSIYASKDGIDQCLYVGESDWCVNNRVRKFFKELAHCSHPDEEHAGAKRAKTGRYTIESHEYKVKYVPWDEIYDIAARLNLYVDYMYLDEYIAHHVKSRYNSSTYLLYGYNGATLKEFLEAA